MIKDKHSSTWAINEFKEVDFGDARLTRRLVNLSDDLLKFPESPISVNTLINHFNAAIAKVRWYCLRWRIETFHKILKSGFSIETCRLGTAIRLNFPNRVTISVDFCLTVKKINLTSVNNITTIIP